jgi:hypothetical protein
MRREAVVLDSGLMHWLVQSRGEIVTYNVFTTEQGRVQLPALAASFKGHLHLGSYYSHDGRKVLRLLATKRFKIFAWHQYPDGQWEPKAVTIDIEEKLRSLDPGISTGHIMRSGERSNTVVLRVYRNDSGTSRQALSMVLDIETKEVHLLQTSTPSSSVLLEIDLPCQLRAMKFFPS